jgi:esterase/lipase superfamily enzyme
LAVIKCLKEKQAILSSAYKNKTSYYFPFDPMKRVIKNLPLIAFGILLLAFGYSFAEFLSTPPRFDLSQIEFPQALREEKDMPVIEVFFATNRAPLAGGMEFSDAACETLSYGIAEVRIPEKFRMADVQRPEIPRGHCDEFLASILRVLPLTAEEFQKRLRARLQSTGSTQATLFVHGIQNTFDSAVRQAGALAFALNLPQPMAVFSCATDPGLSPAAYARCREQVPAAARALAGFLRDEDPSQFDILAHSLGCKVVCAALAQFDKDSCPASLLASQANLILVAPDVDKGDFKSLFVTSGATASRHTTVYVARNDKALVFSSILNGGPRAGAGIGPATQVENLFDEDGGNSAAVEIVDATFINNARTSHGYFYQNRAALSDLQNLLRNDIPACQRQLLRHEKAKHSNYWIIPP